VQSIASLAAWAENTPLALLVGESDIVYPLLLSMHVIGLATFGGLLTIVDLRLFGNFNAIPYAGLLGPLRLAWCGLVINVISGIALFASQATMFIENTPFLIKLSMIVLAASTAGVLHASLKRNAATWDASGHASRGARATAALCLAAIASAIVAGRLIAYF
jgi:hypothetical protein